MEYGAVITFAIILLSVPLQFYLSPKTPGELKYYLTRFVDDIRYRLAPLSEYIYGPTPKEEILVDEATEILDALLKREGISLAEGHFASSDNPRDPRPPHIKFKVGQVFRHRKSKYRAVIIGWDEVANAPDWWLKEIHQNKAEWSNNPNYLVLIDTRDKHIPQIGYVIEENIEVITDQRVIHPFLDKYFERLGPKGSYILRPWLQRIYPFD